MLRVLLGRLGWLVCVLTLLLLVLRLLWLSVRWLGLLVWVLLELLLVLRLGRLGRVLR